jgi:CheY-like chemotaxis protein
MEGEIGAESVEGTGSTFWFEIPLDESRSLSAEPAATQPPRVTGAEGPERECTVLYIEDNPSNFRLVERVLARRPNVELLTAIQGGIGLDIARDKQPDLILLDLHLPDIHGSEVLRRIREDAVISRTPVVIISADVTSNQVERLLDAGAQAYLPKPLDVQELLRIMNDVLEN